MIVVAMLGLLAAIAIPNYLSTRSSAQKNACINNLRQIDGAIQRWALENKKDTTVQATYLDISAYLKSAVICPYGGATFGDSYSLQSVADKPACLRLPRRHFLPPDTAL